MPKLKNNKHEMFCRYYIQKLNGKKFNGTRAAIKAGYKPKSARSQASMLLTKPNIQARIQELQQSAFKRTDIDIDFILSNYKKIVEDDISNYLEFGTDYFGEERTPYTTIKVKDSVNIDTWNVKKIVKGKDGQFTIEIHDKLKALHDLGDYLKLFADSDDDDSDTIIDNFSPLLEALKNHGKVKDNEEDQEDN